MYQRIKRRFPLAIIGVLLLSILTACNESPEEKFKKVELNFLELQRDGEDAYAYYEAPKDKSYYKISISSYQYNNWEDSGLPTKLKVIRDKEPYVYFGGGKAFDALFLTDLDETKSKDFKDIDLADLSYSDLEEVLYVVDYWKDTSEKTKNK